MLWTAVLVAAAPALAKPVFGGYGHLSNGFVVGDLGGLDQEVRQAIGGGTPGVAQTWGGGGRMLLFRRLLLGGRGYGIFNATSTTERGSVALQGGGGGIDLGGVVYSDNRSLVFLYAGAQGLGFDVTVRDNTDTGTTFGDTAIASGREATVASGAWLLDVGAGSHEFLFRAENSGGWTLGGEVGALIGLSGEAWSGLDGKENPGLGSADVTMFYFRLNVGGGGFSSDDD